MAKIVQLKAAEAGYMWVKLEMPGAQGELTIMTAEEIKRLKQTALSCFHEALLEFSRNYSND